MEETHILVQEENKFRSTSQNTESEASTPIDATVDIDFPPNPPPKDYFHASESHISMKEKSMQRLSELPSSNIWHVKLSGDATKLAVIYEDGVVSLWSTDLSSPSLMGSQIALVKTKYIRQEAIDVCIAYDGSYLGVNVESVSTIIPLLPSAHPTRKPDIKRGTEVIAFTPGQLVLKALDGVVSMLELDSWNVTAVFDPSSRILSDYHSSWKVNTSHRHILSKGYASMTRETSPYNALVKLNDGSFSCFLPPGVDIFDIDIAPDKNLVALARLDVNNQSGTQNEIQIVFLDSGTPFSSIPLPSHHDKGQNFIMRFLSDGERIVVTDGEEILVADIATGEIMKRISNISAGSNFDIHPNGYVITHSLDRTALSGTTHHTASGVVIAPISDSPANEYTPRADILFEAISKNTQFHSPNNKIFSILMDDKLCFYLRDDTNNGTYKSWTSFHCTPGSTQTLAAYLPCGTFYKFILYSKNSEGMNSQLNVIDLRHDEDTEIDNFSQAQVSTSSSEAANIEIHLDHSQYWLRETVPTSGNIPSYAVRYFLPELILSDALTQVDRLREVFLFLKYIRVEPDSSYLTHQDLGRQCDVAINFIEEYLSDPDCRHLFSRIGDGTFPLAILMALPRVPHTLAQRSDDIIQKILAMDAWVPSFHDTEHNRCELSIALEFSHRNLVQDFADYMTRNARNKFPGYATTLISNLAAIQAKYPDLVRGISDGLSLIRYRGFDGRTAEVEIAEPIVPVFIEYPFQSTPRQTLVSKYIPSVKAKNNQTGRITEALSQITQSLRYPFFNMTKRPAQLCIAPLPMITTLLQQSQISFKETHTTLTELLKNADVSIASPWLEALIIFKWNLYIRTRYYILLAFMIIYFLFFALSASPSQLSIAQRVPLAGLVIAFSILLAFQEARQILGKGILRYLRSIHNWITIIVVALSITYSSMLIQFYASGSGHQSPDPPTQRSLAAFGIIFFWVYILFCFRIHPELGILLSKLVQLAKSLVWFLFVLVWFIFAFSHALYALLANTSQQSYTTGGQAINSTSSLQGGFNNFGNALGSVYFLMGNDYSSLQGYDGSVEGSMILLKVVFVFIAVIFLLNILIVLLNSAYATIADSSRRAWLLEMAEIVSNIEQYWMAPSERENVAWFNGVLVYYAYKDDIEAWENKINIEKSVTRKDLTVEL